ncbi:hypothetical protein FRC02_006794 [Tulasnella sp. 418]|nr:hypothetical protein FRC02_006794 [Tulasnella sp. 418]
MAQNEDTATTSRQPINPQVGSGSSDSANDRPPAHPPLGGLSDRFSSGRRLDTFIRWTRRALSFHGLRVHLRRHRHSEDPTTYGPNSTARRSAGPGS